MAKKKDIDEEIGAVEGPTQDDLKGPDPTESTVAPVAANQPSATNDPSPDGPVSGDYCRLVNKSKRGLACPLRDGTTVYVGPRCANRDIHISKPILKKLRTKQLFIWAKTGWLEFRECQGGE